jgi:hypothetical protein
MRDTSGSRLWLVAAVLVVVGCGPREHLSVRIDGRSARLQNAPIVLPDSPSCESLGLTPFAYKIEPAVSGTYGIDAEWGGLNTVTVSVDGVTFDWSATLTIDAVIVKGGPDANLYTYAPEAISNAGEPALHAPVSPSTGTYYGLSHLEFCFDYELAVAKTAVPSFERRYGWSIDKTSTVTELLLSAGQVHAIPYRVEVRVAGHDDGDYRVAGAVTVHNPAPFAATIESITDVLGDAPVTLDCGDVELPYAIAANATLVCTYDSGLAGSVMPASLTNVVEVATSGLVGGGSALAVADFTMAELRPVDDCVEVSDDLAGPLGTACVPGPHSFTYSWEAGPFECGEHQVANVAAFVTDDTGATASDSWWVPVTVPCAVGCTLTPGYWKTHSSYGPAPYDDAWALLVDGSDTAFYLSGQSYLGVLQTAPQGNAYYILAHAFAGAELNRSNGASFGAATAAWSEAKAIFESYTPADFASLKGKGATDLRAYALARAATLDAYNNGLIGPGHCSE